MSRTRNILAAGFIALTTCAAVLSASGDARSAGDSNAGVSLDHHPDILYPWCNDYSGMMTMKPIVNWGNTFGDHRGLDLDLVELMNWTRKVDNLTRGVPKLFVLVGQQEGGHDAQYPYLASLNPKLKRPQDASVKDSFDWFLNEARNYHCTVCFHVDCLDAYPDSPLWKTYVQEGLLIRGSDGSPRPNGAWAGRTSYRVNLVEEWKKGFLQKRLNELFEAVPQLEKSGVLYFDANVNFFGDPLDHTSAADQLNAFHTMCCWLKARHGVDVICEYTYPALYGFVPVGFTRPSSFGNDPLDAVPPYLASGGRPNAGGETMTALFGYNTQVQGSSQNANYWKTPEKDPALSEFFYYTLPYLYVNRLLCLGVTPNESATFSDGVQRIVDKKSGQIVMLQHGKLMQIGNDVFIPPVWRGGREIISYSASGKTRSWAFPESWDDVKAVDIYQLTADGPVALEKARGISDHAITLALKAGEAVTIVPAGADVNANPATTTQGEAKCLELDTTTRGDWPGRYGSQGWWLAAVNPKLPDGVHIHDVGFRDTFVTAEPTNSLFLRNPALASERLGTVKTAFLNGIVDIMLPTDRSTEADLYLVNFDGTNRKTLVEALDPGTRKVLAVSIIEPEIRNAYARFSLKGHVLLRVTKLLGPAGAPTAAPMIGGVFLGDQASVPPKWELKLDPQDCISGWGTARVDVSVAGAPLSVGGTPFKQGVGTHAPSTWITELRGQAAGFRAKVGVQDGARTVEFIVRGDGKILFRSGVMHGGEKARDVNVSLKDIQTLSLEVTDGGDGNDGDHADWIEPTIVSAGK